MRVLVIGKKGQLAQALTRIGGGDVRALGRADFDVFDAASLHGAIGKADTVINAAAYTEVDRAEHDEAAAFRLNHEMPALLARGCAAASIPLVHVSTDYVFDGAKGSPYVEEDARAPLNAYGRSKAAGEDAVRASGARHAIVRTSWLFDAGARNFVETMLRLAEGRIAIDVVQDEIGTPSWAVDVAHACLALARGLCDGGATGVFHAANHGQASRAEFAEAIFEEARARGLPSADVRRISSADFPTIALRPRDTRLDTAKIHAAYGVSLRPWRAALQLCLDARARMAN